MLFAISSQVLGPTGLKKVENKSWKWFGHIFADMCYTIMVCSKWGGLRHLVVTTTRKFRGK